jgi:uncharacterized repeat protein (TIGR01451 family)
MIVGVAVIVPVATDAQTSIALEGSFRAANVTANDAEYKEAVNAGYDQVVKLQVYYANTSSEDANDVRVKITMPEKSGVKQAVTAIVKGSNTNELKDGVTLTLDNEQAMVQYIPDTAIWKHNSGSAEEPKIEETKISDEVVVGAQGVALEKQKPGAAFGSTVSVQAKVMVPGVKVVKESEVKGETNKWSANNNAKSTDSLRHLISYQNTSNAQQKQVVIRSALPAKMQLVPDSTMLYNSSNPTGVKVASDAVSADGIVIGNYGPGANAYVIFETTFAAADQLVCGNNEFRVIGYVRPEGAGEYFNSSVTTAKRECESPAPTQPQQAPAAYSCDLLTLTKADNRKVAAKVDYTAKNGAKLKMISYNFGDSTPALSTDKTAVDHTYAKDGTYTVTATLTISANGKDQTSTSAACAQQVSFAPPAATPAAPVTPKPSQPVANTDLPNSGPGDVVMMFVGASVVGFLVHRLLIARWLQRS